MLQHLISCCSLIILAGCSIAPVSKEHEPRSISRCEQIEAAARTAALFKDASIPVHLVVKDIEIQAIIEEVSLWKDTPAAAVAERVSTVCESTSSVIELLQVLRTERQVIELVVSRAGI